MLRLIGLPVSPATERARWALDYAGLTYHFEEYLPGVTTAWVRLRARRLTGFMSVPILLGPGVNLPDSWDIARYAAEQKPATGLLPPAELQKIKQLNDVSEKLFYAGRILAVQNMLASDEALLALIPSMFPAVLHRALLPVVRKASRDLLNKYADPGRSNADQLRLLGDLLRQVRQQLNGKPYLLEGSFSYADITIIAALQVIKPVASRHIPLTGVLQSCWTSPALAEEYADLLAWRDGVYHDRRYRDYLGTPVTRYS